MQALSRKELSLLTMKQIREYAVIKGAKKVPRKWQDKTKALDWVEKNLSLKVEAKKEPTKTATKKKTTKKVVAKKSTKDKAKRKLEDKQAVFRRQKMVEILRKETCTALELKDKFGNEYKSVLDDLHAIRHNRVETYIKDDEMLLGTRIGRYKAFQVIKKKNKDKVEEKIQNEITID